MTWQPIKTAPRDTTSVLLYTTCHGQVEAWFQPHGDAWVCDAWICADDAFRIEVERTPDGYNDGTATHWTPLLAAPTDLAQAARKWVLTNLSGLERWNLFEDAVVTSLIKFMQERGAQ